MTLSKSKSKKSKALLYNTQLPGAVPYLTKTIRNTQSICQYVCANTDGRAGGVSFLGLVHSFTTRCIVIPLLTTHWYPAVKVQTAIRRLGCLTNDHFTLLRRCLPRPHSAAIIKVVMREISPGPYTNPSHKPQCHKPATRRQRGKPVLVHIQGAMHLVQRDSLQARRRQPICAF